MLEERRHFKHSARAERHGSAASAASSPGASPAALSGSLSFNQTKLGQLDAALKKALAGKDPRAQGVVATVPVE